MFAPSFFFFYAIDVSGSVPERLPPVSSNLSKKKIKNYCQTLQTLPGYIVR